MSRIKSRLSAYRDYLRPLVMEGKPMSSEDVLVMIQQLQDDLKKDERPKLTKIEKCFVESLNDKWDYLCRNSNGELEAVSCFELSCRLKKTIYDGTAVLHAAERALR